VLLASSLTSRIHEYIPGSGGVNTGNCNGSVMLVISSIKRGTGLFVIYDKTSQVTVQDNNPLYCMSASEPSGYKWQTNINSLMNGIVESK
jgi:hypothetical protein